MPAFASQNPCEVCDGGPCARRDFGDDEELGDPVWLCKEHWEEYGDQDTDPEEMRFE